MSHSVTIVQGAELTLHGGLDASIVALLRETLSLANPAYVEALRAGRHPGGIAPKLDFVRRDIGGYHLPRHSLERVTSALVLEGITVVVEARRQAAPPAVYPTPRYVASPTQARAITAAVWARGGVIIAPPGSGKTVMGLLIAAKLATPVLWITHTAELVRQTMTRAEQVLGLDATQIGVLGGGKKRPGTLVTVALVQTLAKMSREDLATLSRDYGLVVVDECHLLPAMVFSGVIRCLASPMVLGLTATPVRRDGLHPLLHWLLGATVAALSKADLADRLVQPTVELRETGCRADKDEWVRLVSALVADPERTARIAAAVAVDVQHGRRPIVLTTRVDHARTIARHLALRGVCCGVLYGEMKESERKAIVKGVESGFLRGLVATTGIVGVGFDCPLLDTLHLAVPVSWSGSVEQYLGRISRTYPGKVDAWVRDWIDGAAMAQGSARKRLAAYRKLGLHVVGELPHKNQRNAS